jgi:tetratricopeptide (TPR) repeat protein
MRIALLACLVFLSSKTEAYYDFNPRLREAYSKIIQLRLEEGKAILLKEKQYNPGNHLTVLYENYIDFLVAFITEEERHFQSYKKNSSERISILSKEEKEGSSAYHLYSLAEMTLQGAMLKIKFKEYVSGATEIRKAHKMIQRNLIIFPSFLLNRKLEGFVHTLVGAVPQEYRWITDLVGMQGTVPGGTEELRSLYDLLDGSDHSIYKEEILFYLSNIHNTFSQDESEAEELLDLITPFTDRNPLLRYCFTNTAMKWGRNDEALEMFEPVLSDKGTFPFYYLDYKRGLAKLRKLDLSAENDFHFFLRNFGGMNHRKSVYQKLAWIELLRGNKVKYNSYMQECIKAGAMNVDEDKDAFLEASSGELPNIILLRSRLLFDGGYYRQSWSEIAGKSIDSFPRYRDQLEVTYRLGRIMDKLTITEKAIYYYSKTIKNGGSSKLYFAANSALLLGNIYESNGQYDLALEYYKKCLNFRGHEYQNSIDQKAQAGQDRIKAQLADLKSK